MELHWAGRIDSACTCCGGEAVDWVQVHDGTRRYACESCLEGLLRFGAADTLQALPDTPQAVRCPGCQRLTLQADVGPANRCPDCSLDKDEVLAEAQRVLATPEGEAED